MGTIRNMNGEAVGEVDSRNIFGRPFLCVYGKNKPRNWHEGVVERPLADGLTAYVRFEASDEVVETISSREGFRAGGTIVATRAILDFLKIDEDTLFRQAELSMSADLTSMNKTLEKMGCPVPVDFPELPAYILTGHEDMYGAGAIASEIILKKIHEDMGDFTILPSSVHEVILMPQAKADECPFLAEMVAEINRTTVSASDELSDNVYKYDSTGLHKA